ncbi:glucose-6-phosphate 1-epimerase [Abditibacterium utsteinense]|uniref:Putative glucose-6-phosphate 1-epimerase n=1 Tax=Abditibacterium utsteinense TaxID=1960156 RepID=A0A2S8STL8_9BACT|nr:D-hexose-6-phosphate mutarotase [Abditibacterium utsteinense]PQV64089.1 glucose-6-phosphate 1-epimerase [Abditibacterium utsteinense]
MQPSQLQSLPSIRLTTEQFEAEILLQGAQLMHFAPRGQKPWIFRSPNTPYTPAREIYGGIPVIFPWFGRQEDAPDAPNHGFVRQATWKIESAEQDDSCVTLSLSSDEIRAQGFDTTLWPYDFAARMIFSFGETLGLRFEIENQYAEPFRFECALHTYFAVDNLGAVRIEGLENETFRNPNTGQLQPQNGAIQFNGPLTQMFDASSVPVVIRDQNRDFHLTPRKGWNSTIVWNPGEAMADLSAQDARGFVCVEAGAIQQSAISLEPGQLYALDFSIALS